MCEDDKRNFPVKSKKEIGGNSPSQTTLTSLAAIDEFIYTQKLRHSFNGAASQPASVRVS